MSGEQLTPEELQLRAARAEQIRQFLEPDEPLTAEEIAEYQERQRKAAEPKPLPRAVNGDDEIIQKVYEIIRHGEFWELDMGVDGFTRFYNALSKEPLPLEMPFTEM